jgi:uncharacterized protein YeeX (DUF496 family)
MTREEIHKLPWKAQEYINKLERKLNLTDVSKRSELLLDFLNVTSPSMSIDDKHAIINAYKRNKSNNCG